jgi:hypothetical protein
MKSFIFVFSPRNGSTDYLQIVLGFGEGYIWRTIFFINKTQFHKSEAWRGTLHESRFVPDTYANKKGE